MNGQPPNHSGVRFILAAALVCLSAAVGRSQVLQGEWVDKAERRIAEHRQTPVRIIVMDGDGRPAEGAVVHIEQLQHDFTLGFAAPEDGIEGIDWDQPVWRCFNAVSLDRLGAWPKVQPQPDAWELEDVRAVVREAAGRGMRVRWGGVIPADVGHLADWTAKLRGEALRDAMDAHLAAVLDATGKSVGEFDVCTHLLDHDLLSQPMVRRLYEQAKAQVPEAVMCVRLEDALTQVRAAEMINRIMAMRQAMIPFDAISLEHRIGGILLQAPLERTFDVIGGLAVPVVIGSIEVGGASEASAAVNLETFLRTAFADPNVTGIYFAGVTADDLINPHAALIDTRGATTAGETLDTLFRKRWWNDARHAADELGNVYVRLFAGSHRLTAKLADGETIESRVYIPPVSPQTDSRVILLEPLD